MKNKTISFFLDLFEALSSQEAALEYSRQLLSNHTDFEPYSLFQKIVGDKKGFITAEDIHDFLLTNSLSQSLRACSLLIKQFDYDNDGTLVFSEFLRLVLPANHPALRTAVSQRPIVSKEKLSFDAEFSASRLINKEIEGLMQLETLKKDLFFNCYDFDLKEAFFLIDERNQGTLNFDNLQEFCEKKGHFFSPDNLINLIKRLDRNDDGKVSFEEFKAALLPLEGSILPEKNKTYYSPNRHFEEDFYEKYEEKTKNANSNLGKVSFSPAKSGVSKGKFGSPLKGSKMAFGSQYKEKNSPTQQEVYHNKFCRKHAKPKHDPSQYYFKEQGELARTLKQFVSLDREVDVAKKDLCFCEDFELLSTFQIMDAKGKGTLTANELEQALKKLEIFPTKYELFLFIKRYDRDQDGKFSFSDYMESMVPSELKEVVQRRRPPNGDDDYLEEFSQDDKVLHRETIRALKKCWTVHIENEVAAEALRQRLESRKNFILEKIFYAIDFDFDNFLNEIDIMKFMENHGVECTERDIDSIISRFDLNFDGRISYSEFLQELTPKSSKKY